MKLALILFLLVAMAACAPIRVRQHAGWVEEKGRSTLAKGNCGAITPIAISGPFQVSLSREGSLYNVYGLIVFHEKFESKFDRLKFQYEQEPALDAAAQPRLLRYRSSYGREAEPIQSLDNQKVIQLSKSPDHRSQHFLFNTQIPFKEKKLRITIPALVVDGVSVDGKTFDFEYIQEWRIVALNGC